MRGPGGIAAAIVAATAFGGCALSAGGASDVTQTSARLEANAQSGTTPAWFHFEYARRKADFGTPAARGTPERGPVPPDTPGNFAARVGEDVTGLSPGSGYLFRVCARDGSAPQGVCTDPSPERSASFFVTDPAPGQDSLVGSYSVGRYEPTSGGSVKAASSPSGAGADGELTDRDGRFSPFFTGRVTCLRVQGDRATVGAVGRLQVPYTGEPPTAATELVTIVQGPTGGRWNRVAREYGTTPPDCSAPSPAGGVEFGASHFAIHDVP